MNRPTERFLYWTPRVLGILFALFITLSALDVFVEGQGIAKTILALLMHLIPTAVIVIVLIISWRREWVGAIAFIALAVAYIIWQGGRFEDVSRRASATYLIVSGPLFLIGVLFLINWIYRKELRTHSC